MSQVQFTLSWDSFQQNVCSGLGSLQQNEELVDMTIAADGHFVRVHQLVMSLASPYIKDLIKSAQCQNPVIFLNKISYTSLCSILEYIYTGQVVVAKENLDDLMEAAKALLIKGLKDMDYRVTVSKSSGVSEHVSSLQNKNSLNTEKETQGINEIIQESNKFSSLGFQDTENESMDEHNDDPLVSSSYEHSTHSSKKDYDNKTQGTGHPKKLLGSEGAQIQYSVSNQGNLQLILNRYVYYLRYTGKSSQRKWYCIDNKKIKCPASVVTKDNIVVQRAHAHIHPFHDKTIGKKVRENSVFSMVKEAEQQGETLKKSRKTDDK